MDEDIIYAVWPGSVLCDDGITRTFTAAELAALYGVDSTAYVTITNETQLPRDLKVRMHYIELKPRADNRYENIMYTQENDGEDVAYRPDFDGDKKYIQETDPLNVDSDVDFDFHKRNN
jgi:hypothetical protein